jgi:hypothetical protein
MDWRKKLSRRELCQLAMTWGASSKILFPPLLGFLSKQAMAQVSSVPKMLLISYGEGVGQGSGTKQSLFGSNGLLIENGVSQLTRGFSGLAGIEEQTSILEGVGGQHAIRYYSPTNKSWNMKTQHVSSVGVSEHMIAGIAPLNGGVFGVESIDRFLAGQIAGLKTVSFSAIAQAHPDYGAISFSNSYKEVACNGQEPEGPGFNNRCTNYNTPITELDGLILTLGLGGGGTAPPTNGSLLDLRKLIVDNVLGVADSIKGSVSQANRQTFDEYQDFLNSYKDSLNSNGNGNQNNCSIPSLSGGTTNVHKGLDAARVMLMAMSCHTLDIGNLSIYQSAGTANMFQGINYSEQGVTSSSSAIPGLDVFMNQNIGDKLTFFYTQSYNKGNHHFSHNGNVSLKRDAELCFDYMNSSIHRLIFQMSQGMTTATGESLSQNCIVSTFYGMGHTNDHLLNNCPIFISSDGNYFNKNKVRLFAETENPFGEAPQGRRWAEYLHALGKIYLPSLGSFGDSRAQYHIDLQSL